jgi:FkbH-like protein
VAEASRDQTVVRSQFLEVLPLDTGNFLCLQTLVQARLVVKPEVLAILDAFAAPRRLGDVIDEFVRDRRGASDRLHHVVTAFVQNRMLFAGTHDEERTQYLAVLSQWYGRDPETARQAARRFTSQAVPRFAAPVARDLDSFVPAGRRLDVVMVGLCDVQIEMDVLRETAREFGIDLHPVATFETTLDVLRDGGHHAVIVGSLGARHGHWHRADGGGDFSPSRYASAMRDLLVRIRALTGVPVLVHNLPVPTCSPLGLAERGADSAIERCRRINRDLVEIAAEYPDIYVLDVDAALAFEGKRRLLDDRVMTTTHLGGLGWWTMMARLEVASVHGIRPPVERLSELGVTDPFEFDRVVAAEELAMLAAIFGVGRRDTVVVALDGTLWPGDLTTTGSPFPAGVDFGTWSFHGFYLGVAEALRGLIGRGLRLGAVTRGDETTVRARWRYPGRAPIDRLLMADDFAALRFGVSDPPTAVREIADELETTAAQLVFIASDAVDRAAVRVALPETMVLGDNPFAVRGALLTHPALQVVAARQEGVEHPAMMVALARREKARKGAGDERDFVASLEIRCEVGHGVEPDDLDRVHDLVVRTRQFTTTGRQFTREALAAMDGAAGGRVFTLRVEDRFADYGLVGVAVVIGSVLELLLLSCRVVGLGVDRAFLRVILQEVSEEHATIRARLLMLAENAPARGLFRNNGFRQVDDGTWEIARDGIPAPGAPPSPEAIRVTVRGAVSPRDLAPGASHVVGD